MILVSAAFVVLAFPAECKSLGDNKVSTFGFAGIGNTVRTSLTWHLHDKVATRDLGMTTCGRRRRRGRIRRSGSSPSLDLSAGSFYPFERNGNSEPTKAMPAMTAAKLEEGDAKRRQLLGMPGASAPSEHTEKWKIRLQLTKPITWVPLSLSVMCGVAASGNYHWTLEDVAKGLVAMLLAGPLMEGFSQTINDWYDRDIDAVNEPYRPIPSGAITEREVIMQIFFLLFGALGTAHGLDMWAGHNSNFPVLKNALLGSFIAYIYSAPPLKLKQNGWTGDLAIGACYISLPWWCGQSMFGQLDQPVYWILPLVYSISGLGAGIVNDFKSIEGDRKFGIASIPVLYGTDTAARICAASQTLPQLGVVAYLYWIGEPLYAALLIGLVLPQIYFQATLLLPNPTEKYVEYQASSQTFLFLGLLSTALCIGHHDWSLAQ